MHWPNIEAVRRRADFPRDYSFAQIARAEVPALIRLIPEWYPDVLVGEESCHLREEFWETRVQLREVTHENRDIFGIVIRSGSEIVGFVTMQKNPDALTLMGRLGSVAPEHRGAGLAKAGVGLIEAVGREMGAEALIQIASLHSTHPQYTCEANGYQLCGILAGHDRDRTNPTQVRRVFEAYYIKLLVGPENLQIPALHDMTPSVQKLWKQLFPGLPPR